jgi:integrase
MSFAPYLEKDQITALLDAVPRGDARGRRDYTLLLFVYNTGARVQEVADTRLSWLTLTPLAKVDPLGKGRK